MIDRSFCRIAAGLLHVRSAGPEEDRPILMAHGGPGSSSSLVPLIAALATDRRVIAPDMMGHGDSDATPVGAASIGFYARCLAELLDELGIEQVDAYGHHTGAQVIAALAATHPARIRRIVLDGAALFSAEQRAEFIQRYAPPIVPDESGAHFSWVWDFASELTRHFPYYRRDEAHRLHPGTVRPADVLTDVCVDMMKGWRTYHLAYNAAFADDVASSLGRIQQPTLVLETAGDPLGSYAAQAAALLPHGRVAKVERADKANVIGAYFAT